ncbi:MAG: hypothetical protein FJ381_04220 [Verrucomicrobia bacterium]|nr:hypothetical protein [Verrucomicrobiota bacterium]
MHLARCGREAGEGQARGDGSAGSAEAGGHRGGKTTPPGGARATWTVQPRTWPVPSIRNLWLQSSRRPIGPRAWRRSVLMPISAP